MSFHFDVQRSEQQKERATRCRAHRLAASFTGSTLTRACHRNSVSGVSSAADIAGFPGYAFHVRVS